MADIVDDFDSREQSVHIDRMLAASRKRQEATSQPWIFMVSGMTAGATLFAAGAAFFKLLT